MRLWSIGGMILRGENRRTRRKIVPLHGQVFSPILRFSAVIIPSVLLVPTSFISRWHRLVLAISSSITALFWFITQRIALSSYHYSLRNNNPEEHISQLLRGGSLKSRTISASLKILLSLVFFNTVHGGRDGVVGRSTRYGLDGTGIEPRWGKELFFSLYSSSLAVGPTQPSLHWVPGRKAAGA
jgi:hypothetical protein